MYDCATIAKLLHPHLDRELDVKESLRVQAHLQECPYCRDTFLTEKEFLDLLRPHIAPEPRFDFQPPGMAAIVSRAVRQRERYRRALSPILFALSGALAAVITLALFKGSSVSIPTKGTLESAEHRTNPPRNIRWLQTTSSEAPLSSPWIADRLSCTLDAPPKKIEHQTLLTPELLRKGRPRTASR